MSEGYDKILQRIALVPGVASIAGLFTQSTIGSWSFWIIVGSLLAAIVIVLADVIVRAAARWHSVTDPVFLRSHWRSLASVSVCLLVVTIGFASGRIVPLTRSQVAAASPVYVSVDSDDNNEDALRDAVVRDLRQAGMIVVSNSSRARYTLRLDGRFGRGAVDDRGNQTIWAHVTVSLQRSGGPLQALTTVTKTGSGDDALTDAIIRSAHDVADAVSSSILGT